MWKTTFGLSMKMRRDQNEGQKQERKIKQINQHYDHLTSQQILKHLNFICSQEIPVVKTSIGLNHHIQHFMKQKGKSMWLAKCCGRMFRGIPNEIQTIRHYLDGSIRVFTVL